MENIFYKKSLKYGICLMLVFAAFSVAVPTNVNAQDGDFEISVYPESQTVNPGGSATFLVTVTSIDGFVSPVDLSATGLPDGATAYFNPNPVTPTGNSILTISTCEDTPTGSYPITIIGTGGGLTRSTSTTITVDFGLVPKQFGTFAGQVTSCDTGDPIEGVKVIACQSRYEYYRYTTGYENFYCPYGGGLEDTTDTNGYYTIENVPLNYKNAPKDYVVAFHIT